MARTARGRSPAGSTADVIVREYRLGDDLRRVHWRSSARAGELMVRREEQPWQSRCTLMVDNRASAHRGQGAGLLPGGRGHRDGLHRLPPRPEGYQVRLVTSTGQALGEEWHERGGPIDTGPILDQLAVLPLVRVNQLATGWIDETVSGGSFVAVLGAIDDHDHAFFRRVQSGPGSAYALVLGVDQWSRLRSTTEGRRSTTRDCARPPKVRASTGCATTAGRRSASAATTRSRTHGRGWPDEGGARMSPRVVRDLRMSVAGLAMAWFAVLSWRGMIESPYRFLWVTLVGGMLLVAAGVTGRALRWRWYAVLPAQLAVGLVFLTWVYARDRAWAGLVPTRGSVTDLADQVVAGALAIASTSPPCRPSTPASIPTWSSSAC